LNLDLLGRIGLDSILGALVGHGRGGGRRVSEDSTQVVGFQARFSRPSTLPSASASGAGENQCLMRLRLVAARPERRAHVKAPREETGEVSRGSFKSGLSRAGA